MRSKLVVAGVVAACLVAGGVCSASYVTDDLIFYVNANDDTDSSDGWDFTQPAVGGSGSMDLYQLQATGFQLIFLC